MNKQEEAEIINKAERVAEHNERLIVKFTNIDKEDFTHGFRGISIKVKAGSSYPCRFPEADHLATHLARKILSREKKAQGIKGQKGSLYTKEEVAGLKEKMVQSLGEQTTETLTPEERRKKDLEGLNKDFAKPESPPPAPLVPPKKKEKIEVTKAQIIKDLKERKIEADINKPKEELLKQLMEAEASNK